MPVGHENALRPVRQLRSPEVSWKAVGFFDSRIGTQAWRVPEGQSITRSVLAAVVSTVVPTGTRPWLEEVKRDT
jgi:hypothetical protein